MKGSRSARSLRDGNGGVGERKQMCGATKGMKEDDAVNI
jgi:hypothetical protein